MALPHRARLEEYFGRSLADIEVYAGPTTTRSLDALGAVSAASGSSIYFADRNPPVDVAAHEVAHALQAHRLRATRGAALHVEPERSGAEREAARITHGVTDRSAAPAPITRGLAPGAIALLRRTAPPTAIPERVPTLARSTEPLARIPDESGSAAKSSGEPGRSPIAATPAPAAPQVTTDVAPQAPTADAIDASAASAASTEAPVVAAPAMDPAQDAARQAAAEGATAAITSAATPADRLRAFAEAPPSVKAAETGSLTAGVADLAASESRAAQEDVPPVGVEIPGAAQLTTGPAKVSESVAVRADVPPPPAAAPSVAPVIEMPGAAGTFRPSIDAGAPLALATNAPPATLAARIDDSLAAVPTSDEGVPRTAGERPAVQLSGEGDPARVAQAEDAARRERSTAKDAAARAVREGPGPDLVRPVAVSATKELDAVEVAARPPAATPVGPDQYAAMNLPQDVQASFDAQQGAAMQQSLAGAVKSADDAATQRDASKQAAIDEARTGEDRLSREAETGRDAAVREGRGKIGDARSAAIAAQDAEIVKVEESSTTRRRSDTATIDREVDGGRKKIDADFAKADSDITTEVSSGEAKATAEKKKAERAAENDSWWDKAVDFVKSAISSLMSVVGKIFDAVRAAVNKVLDAVKKAALAVIAGVASFVKAAVAAFGEFLKAAITGLIGGIFPGLAAKLNGLIDSAVTFVQKAVDDVADKLSKGVNALVEGLRAGLDKLIDVFQSAVEFAVSLATAALTGDWGAVFRKVLEAVLKLVGVEPAQFYAFIGRAEETLHIIVNDPLTFVGNVAAAVKGGIVAFAKNIVPHLKQGVVGWLTGALGSAGITMPTSFDLRGVLDLARQLLGLTWENLKAKAVKLIGAKNVERIEQAASWITTLVTEGWGALWNRILADLASLRDAVFDGIRTFIQERVIFAAITKIASLLNPAGAIVQLVLAAWNLYTFLRDQLARLGELVHTVVDTIGDIARGVLDKAIVAVEGVLGRLLPLAIDLLARLLGLGNVGGKVKEIIEKVRGAIDKAIDKLIAKVVGLFQGGRGGKGSAYAGVEGKVTEAEHRAYAKKAFAMLEKKAVGKIDPEEVAPIARGLEPGLTKALAPGVKLTFLFTGGPDDAADGSVHVTVRIAPNDANVPLQLKGEKALGLAEIGEIKLHGAQRRRYRGKLKLLEGESEHVIPYAVAANFLEAAGFESGRLANKAFDKALTTIVIYERAARIKTKTDNPSSKAFGRAAAAILKDIHASRKGYDEADSSNEATTKLDAAWDKLTALLKAEKTSRVTATNAAVSDEHGEKSGTSTRGARRGENSPVPVAVLVSSAAQKEYDDIVQIAEQTFQSAKRRQTPDRREVITRITLAQLNDAKTWPAGALAMIENLGARTAQKVADSRALEKFASIDDLRSRALGVTKAFLKRVKP